MAKKQDRRNIDDRIAERRGVPGRDRQVPAEDFVIRSSDGQRVLARNSMNFRGLMGGLPSNNARSLRDVAEYSRRGGATDSAAAAETRARNVESHDDMTRRSQRAIRGEMLRARASSPEASTYDRLRHRVFEATGMKKGGKVETKKMAKGGSVSSASKRADGIARKGKTKGRFV